MVSDPINEAVNAMKAAGIPKEMIDQGTVTKVREFVSAPLRPARELSDAELFTEHDEFGAIADTHPLDCLCESCQRFLDIAEEIGRRQNLR